jgi:hypothetical protein
VRRAPFVPSSSASPPATICSRDAQLDCLKKTFPSSFGLVLGFGSSVLIVLGVGRG